MDKAAATTNVARSGCLRSQGRRTRGDAPHRSRSLADPDAQSELVVRELPLGRGAYVRARLALLLAVSTAHDARVVFGTTPTGTVAYVAGFASDRRRRRGDVHVVARPGSCSDDAGAAIDPGGNPALPTVVPLRLRRQDGRVVDELAARNGSIGERRRLRGRIGSGAARLDGCEWTRSPRSPSVGFAPPVRPARPRPEAGEPGVDAADRVDVGRTRLMGRRAIGRG